MSAFFRVFSRDKKKAQAVAPEEPKEPVHIDPWLRTDVTPEEVAELVRGLTAEVKSRGLSTPFLLLPFRPDSDSSLGAKNFIRSYFDANRGRLAGLQLAQELRLTEVPVLCSALKWIWGRLPGGVVTWEVYEMFRQGEVDSSMAQDSFATFIPISAESKARSMIIFDFFDLLSAVAAHGKHNGLGGMKLSRLAGWWAFEHSDLGWGFEGGYASWGRAADSTCHLFFGYLRSLSPPEGSGVSLLPTSLRALLASIDYPPTTPPHLQSKSVRVEITVEQVSPTPFSLLRRAKNFQYKDTARSLQIFREFQDPVGALTDECRRVLRAISSTNHSASSNDFKFTLIKKDEPTWSRFQDMGFSSLLDEEDDSEGEDRFGLHSEGRKKRPQSLQLHPRSPSTPDEESFDLARPTTPSWADFTHQGFGEEQSKHPTAPTPVLLAPDQYLPPIEMSTSPRLKSAQSNRRAEESLDPGELGGVTPFELDDAFWWVWMSSLAGEETAARKAVFGRCAVAETQIKGGRWLVVEEKVKGAAKIDDPLAHKKKRKLRRRGLTRKKSTGQIKDPAPEPKNFNASLASFSRTNIGPDQTAKIRAAAAALKNQGQDSPLRREHPGRRGADGKTNSVFTLQPVIMSEASPAMKWANKYDKEATRDAYLNGFKPPGDPATSPMPSPSIRPPPIQEQPGVSSTTLQRHEEQKDLPALPASPEPAKEVVPESKRKTPEPMKKTPEPVRKAPEPVRKAAPEPARKPAPEAASPEPVKAEAKPAPKAPTSPVTERKPVPQSAVASPKIAPPAQSPKIAAASPKIAAPEPQPAKKIPTPKERRRQSIPPPGASDKNASKVSRLRNMFGNRTAAAAPAPTPAKAATNGKATAAPAPTPEPKGAPTPPHRDPSPTTWGVDDEKPAAEPTLDMDQTEVPPESPNPTQAQHEAAAHEFSKFDQGPLEDQPAFVPEEDDSPAPSPKIHTAENKRAPSPIDTMSGMIREEDEDEVSPVSPAPLQDRWAQIKKNAAERAKSQAATMQKDKEVEEKKKPVTGGGGQQQEGEESIESRVARIKARVAELTGNMEGGQPQQGARP